MKGLFNMLIAAAILVGLDACQEEKASSKNLKYRSQRAEVSSAPPKPTLKRKLMI